jgi:hypothetical protein
MAACVPDSPPARATWRRRHDLANACVHEHHDPDPPLFGPLPPRPAVVAASEQALAAYPHALLAAAHVWSIVAARRFSPGRPPAVRERSGRHGRLAAAATGVRRRSHPARSRHPKSPNRRRRLCNAILTLLRRTGLGATTGLKPALVAILARIARGSGPRHS